MVYLYNKVLYNNKRLINISYNMMNPIDAIVVEEASHKRVHIVWSIYMKFKKAKLINSHKIQKSSFKGGIDW